MYYPIIRRAETNAKNKMGGRIGVYLIFNVFR